LQIAVSSNSLPSTNSAGCAAWNPTCCNMRRNSVAATLAAHPSFCTVLCQCDFFWMHEALEIRIKDLLRAMSKYGHGNRVSNTPEQCYRLAPDSLQWLGWWDRFTHFYRDACCAIAISIRLLFTRQK
jgi:hypothetical protein